MRAMTTVKSQEPCEKKAQGKLVTTDGRVRIDPARSASSFSYFIDLVHLALVVIIFILFFYKD